MEEQLSSTQVASDPRGGPLEAVNSQAYAEHLNDPQVQRVQRQAIAARLGRFGGNLYLQRVISRVRQSVLPVQAVAPTPTSTLQREPSPAPSETTSPEPSPAPSETTSPEPVARPTPDELDSVVREELEGFLSEFQNIEVTVRWLEYTGTECRQRKEQVAVNPPYFMNVRDRKKATKTTLKRYDTAIENREAAAGAVQDLISEFSRKESKGGMGVRRARVGKAHPEDIRTILQTALDRGLIKPGKGRDHPDSQDLRDWLDRYGIGVDCSGFVSQA